MIEFCTRRRMLIAVAVLAGVSVAVVVIEDRMSPSNEVHNSSKVPSDVSEQQCPQAVSVTLIQPCVKCSAFEKKVHLHCQESGYHEKFNCVFKNSTTSEIFKSCPKLDSLKSHQFWTFEGVTLLTGVVSYAIVHVRRRRLDRLLMDKVHRQIAAGV